jgi:hypothetical protein
MTRTALCCSFFLGGVVRFDVLDLKEPVNDKLTIYACRCLVVGNHDRLLLRFNKNPGEYGASAYMQRENTRRSDCGDKLD